MSLVVAAFALAMFVVGFVMLTRRIMALVRGSVVDAVVVRRDAIQSLGGKADRPNVPGSSTVIPHFRYLGDDGVERIARLALQTDQRLRSERYKLRYPVGERVRVRIDPARPDIAHDRWLISGEIVFSSLLVLAGAVISVVAIGIFFSP